MPPDRRKDRRPRQKEEDCILIVEGIPAGCRWQELKDVLRSLGVDHVRQAMTFRNDDGTHLGHCIIKGMKEAKLAYEQFCSVGWNGQSVKLSLCVRNGEELRRIAGPVQTVRLPQSRNSINKSTSSYGKMTSPQNSPQQIRHVQTSSVNIQPITSPTTGYYSTPGISGHVPVVADVNGNRGRHSTQPVLNKYDKHSSRYPSNSVSTNLNSDSSRHRQDDFSNMQNGIMHTHPVPNSRSAPTLTSISLVKAVPGARSVFLSGLPYSFPSSKLERMLCKYGCLESCEIQRDSRNSGRGKGVALARYRTSHEAYDAVNNLNDTEIEGRKIRVKFDRDEDSSSSSSSVHESSSGNFRTTSRDSRSTPSANRHEPREPRKGPLVIDGARRRPVKDFRGRNKSREDSSTDSEDDDSTDLSRRRHRSTIRSNGVNHKTTRHSRREINSSRSSSDDDNDEEPSKITRDMHRIRI